MEYSLAIGRLLVDLAGVIIWPVVVFALASRYKEQIGSAIKYLSERLTQAKVGPAQFTFGDQVRAIEDSVAQISRAQDVEDPKPGRQVADEESDPATPHPTDEERDEKDQNGDKVDDEKGDTFPYERPNDFVERFGLFRKDRMRELDDASQLAVDAPELAVISAFKVIERSTANLLSGQDAGGKAGAENVLLRMGYDEKLVAAIADLRKLRNQAAHASEHRINAVDAVEYVDAVRAIISRLFTRPDYAYRAQVLRHIEALYGPRVVDAPSPADHYFVVDGQPIALQIHFTPSSAAPRFELPKMTDALLKDDLAKAFLIVTPGKTNQDRLVHGSDDQKGRVRAGVVTWRGPEDKQAMAEVVHRLIR